MWLPFLFLSLSMLSLWVKKTFWLWGSLLALTFVLAFRADILTPLGLIPLGALGTCHLLIRKTHLTWWRLTLLATITVISLGLTFHRLPGFHNWHLPSYNLWINFDKPFIGFFPLIFSIRLVETKLQWRQMIRQALPLILGGILLLALIGYFSHQVQWDLHLPEGVPLWLVVNLLFVCIPEEAFFRGFLQRELGHWFGDGTLGSIAAIVAASIVFTFAHVFWVPSVPFLFMVFLASILYGTIYHITCQIEASILCHLTLNFLLLTTFRF